MKKRYGDEPVVPGTPYFFSPELCKASIFENEEIEKQSSKKSFNHRGSSSLRDSAGGGSSHGSSSHGGGATYNTSIVSPKLVALSHKSVDFKADTWALGVTALQVCGERDIETVYIIQYTYKQHTSVLSSVSLLFTLSLFIILSFPLSTYLFTLSCSLPLSLLTLCS